MSPLAPSAAPTAPARMASASATRATYWISPESFVVPTVKVDAELGESVWLLTPANVRKGKLQTQNVLFF